MSMIPYVPLVLAFAVVIVFAYNRWAKILLNSKNLLIKVIYANRDKLLVFKMTQDWKL